jgi:hypothetical protein
MEGGFRFSTKTLVTMIVVVLAGQLFLMPGAVASGRGTSVSSAQAAIPGWGTAQLIDSGDLGDATWPRIAATESGDAFAVWLQSDGTLTSVWANRYVMGEGWEGPVMISAKGPMNTLEPDVAVDVNGNAIAVWFSYTDSMYYQVWTNRYSAGAGWGKAQSIDPAPTGGAMYPSVVCDRAGNAFAIWIDSGAIVSSRYVFGKGWGGVEAVETHHVNAQPPEIGVDAKGNAIAVWEDQTSSTYNIWSNRYVVGSGWGSEVLLETDDSGSAWKPKVALDDAGDAIAVWFQMEGPFFTPPHIWANRYVANVGWGTAKLLDTGSACEAWNPRISLDGAGNAIAAWYEYDSSTYKSTIWTARYFISSDWSLPEEINGRAGDSTPDLATNHAGQTMMVWLSYGDVYASRCTMETEWEQPELISSIPLGGIQDTKVAINSDGDAIAVWYQWDGSRYDIWSNRYVAASSPDPSALTEALIKDIQDWGLPKGTTTGLTSKLFDAITLLEKGNDNGALHKLMDFVSVVHALEGKRQLTSAQADHWVTSAESIMDLLR